MENLTTKNIVELATKGGITAILAFIIFFFGNQFLTSISAIQRDLASIRVQIVKIQASILTEEQIQRKIDEKLKLMEYKYHGAEK